MFNTDRFFIYLIVMAGVTYLIRMIPLVAVRKKIKNKFVLSFLHYIPCSVLAVMTIPAVFSSTGYRLSAVIGFIIAVILSYFGKSMVKVAGISCVVVFIAEYFIRNI